MWNEQYTPQQIAPVLMQAMLGFEEYMHQDFRLYDIAPDGSRMLKPPEWVGHGYNRLGEWCQERIYAVGLGVWEQETFGDQLILDDLHPLARRVSRATGPEGGKVAFLTLATALVLKEFSRHVSGEGKELGDEQRRRMEAYLREVWRVDLEGAIINPELAAVHWPEAQEAERRWRRRLELLTRPPLRAPFTDDQIASLTGYRAAFVRDPWFLCLAKDCGRPALGLEREGFHCPQCDYRRDWAWSWMADGSWRRRWDETNPIE